MFFSQPKTLLTVPQAINAGKWRVLYAPFIFLFIALRVGQILTRHQSGLTFILCLLGIIAMAVLYWSIAVGRWRVWAFSNVADIHWLHQRAIVEHILPSDNFFNKLEFKTEAQKVFWNEISRQLETGQITKPPLEDYDLPAETRVFDSKWQFWWIPLVAVFTLPMCYYFIKFIFLETPDKSERIFWFAAPVMILLTAKEGWRGIKMVFSTLEPQIILNNEGIETPEFGLKKWSDISKIEVNTEGYGEDRKEELQLNCPTEDITFTLFHEEEYEEKIQNDDYEDDLEHDYVYIEDFIEEIDEATFEANKNDSRYEKYVHTEFFSKTLSQLTVNPDKLEYLIKVYQARAVSKRRIDI
jgi:hypothetical protein